jgi:beta-N-acetylhexosaminidase
MQKYTELYEKLGPLFMIGIPGLSIDDSTKRFINDFRINNFILFSRNVESPDQLRSLCVDIKVACQQAGLGNPIISIDQEGGTVARLPEPFTQFEDARVCGDSFDPEKAVVDYAETCASELIDIGINMNLAPVLDVCPVGQGYFMEKRSLGDDPYKVGRLGALLINAMQNKGVAACGKHFPGLGAAKLDPHLELPFVERSLEQLQQEDLVPFRDAIDAGVAGIMTSHTMYSGLDPEHLATLSKKILTDLLRQELGYAGVIITDDLEMGAIENERSVNKAALEAFVAGADMLLICHEHSKVEASLETFSAALDAGVISLDRVASSVKRIGIVRHRFG